MVAALVRGEDASWELARLTWESTYDQRYNQYNRPADRVSMEAWCRMIRERSGIPFGPHRGALQGDLGVVRFRWYR